MSTSMDPFGLRSLDVDGLRNKHGAKWQGHPARFSAWVADMDFPVAPAITDRLRAIVARSEFGYPNWGGPYNPSPAVGAFAERMSGRFGWQPRLDRLHELCDVVQGVRVTVQHLSAPGDGIVLHLPAYHPFLDTIDEMDRRLIPVVTDDSGEFDYDDLEQRLSGARVWILCHPHNPLGHVFERAELERIAEISARHDIVVISDEIHADLTYRGHTHIPYESLGPEISTRAVTITSASKAFNLAGLRWAVLHAGNDALAAMLAAMPGHYLGAPNVIAVEATVAAWNEGDAWLADVLSVLDQNRHGLTALLSEWFPEAVYVPPQATYLAWIDMTEMGFGDDPAATFRQRGVELSSGPQFGPQGAGHLRLNFATSPAVLAATVRAMGADRTT